ncbi:MAG: copper amine oxidase N-terminal domain-containing protein [Lachnospirales bacterium]
MKKFLALAVALIIMSVPVVAGEGVNVFSNGNEVKDKGVIVDGRTLVPVRGVFEYMGYSVDWNGDTKTATLTSEDKNTVITLTNGENSFFVNDKEITPDVAQQIINGRFMLPLRAVGEAVDADINWDSETKTAEISNKKTEVIEDNNEEIKEENNSTDFAIPGVSIVEIDPFSTDNMSEIDVTDK